MWAAAFPGASASSRFGSSVPHVSNKLLLVSGTDPIESLDTAMYSTVPASL